MKKYLLAAAIVLSSSRVFAADSLSAARELYVSQPSISQQIRALERELGASLVVRLGRRLALTEAGAQFLGEAERAVAAADSGRERVQQVIARGRAAIRLGAVPSVDSTLLPPVKTASAPHTAYTVALSEGWTKLFTLCTWMVQAWPPAG